MIAGANIHDTKLLAATIEAIVVLRPDPAAYPQRLALDKGYDNPSARGACEASGYVAHIRRIGEVKLEGGEKRHPARRWVVERTLAWLLEVPGDPRPLRQEPGQLPRPHPARLRASLVPAPP